MKKAQTFSTLYRCSFRSHKKRTSYVFISVRSPRGSRQKHWPLPFGSFPFSNYFPGDFFFRYVSFLVCFFPPRIFFAYPGCKLLPLTVYPNICPCIKRRGLKPEVDGNSAEYLTHFGDFCAFPAHLLKQRPNSACSLYILVFGRPGCIWFAHTSVHGEWKQDSHANRLIFIQRNRAAAELGSAVWSAWCY